MKLKQSATHEGTSFRKHLQKNRSLQGKSECRLFGDAEETAHYIYKCEALVALFCVLAIMTVSCKKFEYLHGVCLVHAERL